MDQPTRSRPIETTDLLASLAALVPHLQERADLTEASRGTLDEDMARLRDLGLLSACLSAAHGGVGLGQSAATTSLAVGALRLLGRANLSLARLFEGHMNAVKLVALYGGDDLMATLADRVRHDGLLGVWGADGVPPLTFRREGDGRLRLDGMKRFASGLGLVTHAIVTLGEAGSQWMALVDVRDPDRQDASAWTASAMKATRSGIFDFTGMGIPASALVGAAGDYPREPHFEGGTWRYAAAHIGGAEALVEALRAGLRAEARESDPAQIMRFARARGLCLAGRTLLDHVGALVEEAAGSGDEATVERAVAEALLARQMVEEICVEVMTLVERSLGMRAYVEAGRVERMRRDLGLFLRQAAPDAKLLKAGRTLLAGKGEGPW